MTSIIIPTLNRANELEALINSILRESYQDFEIIVVDNGPSTDNTINIVKAFSQANARVKYISTTLKGCIFARNIGAKEAKGETLLILDDDVEFLSPDTLKNVLKTFNSDPSIGIVGGIELMAPDQVVEKEDGSLPPEIGRISMNGDFNTNFTAIEGHGTTEVDHIRSAFMGIRSYIYNKVDGFDPIYNSIGHDFRADSDVCLKVKRNGCKVVVNPEIKVWHKGAARQRTHDRGKGLRYCYFANRNHVFFMRKFFWHKNVLMHLIRDLFIGVYKPPGILWCLKRFKSTRDFMWLSGIFPSILGKISGHWRYWRAA